MASMFDDSEFGDYDYSSSDGYSDDSYLQGGYDNSPMPDTRSDWDFSGSNIPDMSFNQQQLPSWDPTGGLQSSSVPNMNGQLTGGMTMAPPEWLSQLQGGSQPFGGEMSPEEQQSIAGYKGLNWNPNTPGASASNGFLGQGMNGLSNVLSALFQSKNGQPNFLGKAIGTVPAAMAEGKANTQLAQQIPQVVQAQQQRLSPYDTQSTGGTQMGANSMRDAMQQKLAAAMNDPYGQKIVKDQVDALQKAQAIRDAAAGRRSNNATSSPALIAEQAKVAQNYINSLQNPAGANIGPNSEGLTQLIDALKYGAKGYSTPLASAAGYSMGTGSTQSAIDVLRSILQGGNQ